MTCQQCGGLIMEPDKIYGWGVKICTCPKQALAPINPLIGQTSTSNYDLTRKLVDLEWQIAELRNLIEVTLKLQTSPRVKV